MIITKYRTFRRVFAEPGAQLARDGFPEFPVALVRANGFENTITVSALTSFPLDITCNAEAADAVKNVDEYDWFVSQRTDVQANWPFTVTRIPAGTVESYSGSIRLEPSAATEAEFPEPFTLAVVEQLWFQVDVYVKRRSDGAIQRFSMLKYVQDNLVEEEVVVFGGRAGAPMLSGAALVAPAPGAGAGEASSKTKARGRAPRLPGAAGAGLVAASAAAPVIERKSPQKVIAEAAQPLAPMRARGKRLP